MSDVNMWQIEQSFFEKGIEVICGVDEAGRGPLAGPVCAAAVILPAGIDIPGLNDSKKLSDKRRRELFPIIKEKAIAYGIAFADHSEIDEINILQATYLAMERALAMLEVKPQLALIDGNRAKDFGIPVETVVHGDSLSASIAAASVLAKVTRDNYMLEMAEKYPQYGFDIHKGYGTKAHYAALTEHGHCPIHRMSFLKKFYGEK
jgi:ribonuclease HII